MKDFDFSSKRAKEGKQGSVDCSECKYLDPFKERGRDECYCSLKGKYVDITGTCPNGLLSEDFL